MTDPAPTPLPMASSGCSCCAPGAASAPASGSAGATSPAFASEVSATYRVEGMTCGHCAASVMEDVSALDGVTAVDVNLVAGGVTPVTVTGSASADTVRAAIKEAGYRVLNS